MAKDKYGNIIRKQIDVTKKPSEDLVESKKQRFREIASEALEQQARDRHPYEILSTFQRCGNSVVGNNPNSRAIGSGDSQRRSTREREEAPKPVRSQGDISTNRQSVGSVARNLSVKK